MRSNTPPLEDQETPFWSLHHRSSTALVTEDGTAWSYAALQRQVDPVKAALEAPAKSLVFVLCDHSLSSIAGYLACLQAGHAALLLCCDMQKDLLEPLVELYRPDFIWSPQEIDGGLHEDSGFALGRHRLFRSRELGQHAPLYPELALMLTTSGSTGNPKLVRLSYANLQANARSISEYLGLNAGERPVTSLPMYYSYGLSVVNSHLLSGATLLQTSHRLRTPEFWEFARTHGATSISGVPYVYQILHEMGFDGSELPSLRTMTQAGGHLDVALQEHFMRLARKKGIRYFTMYGQTEATARMSYVPHDRGAEGMGSIGVPIPGGKFEVVEGELVYSGPNVMLGYAENRTDLAKGDELQGRLFTGDMAKLGENGFCYLVGRKKRFVKIMGLRINLDDVERQLTAHVGRKCVVIGTDSNLEVVTLTHGLDEEIIEFIRSSYRISSKLCSVKVVAEIPVMSTGKVDYEALKAAPALPESCADTDVVVPFDAGPIAAAV